MNKLKFVDVIFFAALFYSWAVLNIFICWFISLATLLYFFWRGRRRLVLLLLVTAALSLPVVLVDLFYRFDNFGKNLSSNPARLDMQKLNTPGVVRVKTFLPYGTSVQSGELISRDENGRRKTVPISTKVMARSVLLLGCSFTYGHGVRDNETFASVAYKELRARANIINAGIPASGPNSAYSQLLFSETYLSDLPSKIDVVVYTMLPDHIFRAAGKGLWKWMDHNRLSAKYTVAANGRLNFIGYYGDSFWVRFLTQKLTLAFYERIIRFITPHYLEVGPPYFSEDDFKLTATLINESAILAKKKFGARFIVNYWAHDPVLDRAIRASGFFDRLKGVEVVVSPDLAGMQYLSDGHPSSQAHHLMGKWLASKLRKILF